MAVQSTPYYSQAALYPRATTAQQSQRKLVRFLLGGIVLLLNAAPLARVYAGPLPINFIDILVVGILGLMWVGMVQPVSLKRHAPLGFLLFLYFLFVLGASIREITEYEILMEPTYKFVRFALGMSMAVLLPSVIKSKEDLDLALKMSLVGIAFSSLFAIGYALPQGAMLRLFLNEGNLLFPGRASANLENLAAAEADRAMSPIGGPNVTACWFTLMFPLALMAWRMKPWGLKWAAFAMVTTFLTLGAALLTYGRSTVIALGLIAGTVILFRLFRSWLAMSTLVAATIIFMLTIGLASSSFDFQLVFDKFAQLMEDPTAKHTDAARIASYTTLLPFLEDNPMWMVTGLGLMGSLGLRLGVVDNSDLIVRLEDGEVHSMFAAAFYHFGMLSMLVITCVALVCGLRSAYMSVRRGDGGVYRKYWQCLFAMWMGLIPYWLFTHMFVTAEQGVYFFFFLVGLVIALGKLDPIFRTRRVIRARVVNPPTYPSQADSDVAGDIALN